jgi:hypothetical protein
MLRVVQELEFIPVETVLPVGQYVGYAKEHGNDEYGDDTHLGERTCSWEFRQAAAVHVEVPQDR